MDGGQRNNLNFTHRFKRCDQLAISGIGSASLFDATLAVFERTCVEMNGEETNNLAARCVFFEVFPSE
jgi:hypothetical protein